MTDFPDTPDVCPVCGSRLLSWSFGQEITGPSSHALSLHEVVPFVVLGCEECSETVMLVKDERHLNYLLSR